MPRFIKKSKLTILKEDGIIDEKYKAVICKCECGNIIRCKKTLINTGRKKSCGCAINETEFVSKYIMKMYWTAFILNAKSRKLEIYFNLSDLDELIEKQDFKCALTGLKLILPKTSDEFLLERKWTASIDRIDSTKNYTLDNIQFVHKDINKMKMDMQQDIFIDYCRLVASNAA
jgi:hypothetical protein